jgi:hypothetical protein
VSVEVFVDGEWLSPIDGPPDLQMIERYEDADEALFAFRDLGYVDLSHPKHGRIRVVPCYCPMRIA